ncbi:radical SAM family heme chaperone HemW [Phascolarctobacterium sp.]|uniref:radical SAM family heme chaperone HemW n=1 Tax=Phascolarctobacterium sp. TaxID=2049039 RepID=UPI002A826A6E|nr:radical SAM family heme chaperone HemW [Phascolarctobacterium sp.]MDY5044668.1 radical SAM family heme chaperone HemW [Phascolarctobacterium sp.]
MERVKQNIWDNYHAVYVHIPFCKQKCLYCDFASYACFGEAEMRAYTEALCHEIETRAEEAEKVAASATVYFGGGTPSVLPIDCLEQIVATLKACGFWQEPAEATIEVNPGTADSTKLKRLRAAGFDRVSFGVQSLQDAELRAIGRIHSAQEAIAAIDMARAAGFRRVSCDLIYGLPGQSLASLADTLQRLLATGIEHISVYGLIVEEGTPLERLVSAGKLMLPDEDIAADMYELVQRLLAEAGFERYEISNYAKNGQYSRHNTVYWQYHPYIAFGAAACGMEKALRRTAASTVPEYIAAAQALTSANWRTSELYTSESLTLQQQLEEFMFMGLRRAAGADLAEARTRFGVDVWQRYQKELAPYIAQGLVGYEVAAERLYLTPAGMELGNQIFAIFVNS